MEELRRDRYFEKIHQDAYEQILTDAWARGEEAALTEFGADRQNVYQMLEQAGLQIQRIDRDMVIGGTRYFAEIYVKRKIVYVYVPSVRLWAQHNQMAEDEAEELILAHEFFHYLEYGTLPPAKEIFSVPVLRFGRHVLTRAALSSVSEIGAHAFARTYHRLVMNRQL